MKAMAASNIGQYENAVRSLDDYYRTVQLGLAASFRQAASAPSSTRSWQRETGAIGAIVFGSGQGLVGQFNQVMVDYVMQTLENMPGQKTVWAIGERIQSRFADTDLLTRGNFALPNSISAITPLVGQILIEMETQREKRAITQIYVFHNRPETGAIYNPVSQRLLPLDDVWRREPAAIPSPTHNLPAVMNDGRETLLALVRESFRFAFQGVRRIHGK